ncbi:rhomboid family intramembrane serine protease rho-7 isoform X1 [Haematobia irritans]|uniref:rhomboid family intramembrane serine protease rho-7 isoform X1 n=1 Tax=Haematobia irritans TaxID=7368 RepID=UPI003F50BFD4
MLLRRLSTCAWQSQLSRETQYQLGRDTILLHHGLKGTKNTIKNVGVLRSIRNSSRLNYSTRPALQPLGETGGNVPSGNVIKALVFTGAFSFGSFVGATVMEYENTRNMMLEKARQAKLGWIRRKPSDEDSWENIKRDIKRLWERLSPGEKVFVPICAANLLVFGLWRVPSLRTPMMKYFCSNPAARTVCWPMFLSTFSHYSAFHIFANMYVLHSFSNLAVLSLGKEQFLAVYLTAGVIASMTSIFYKALTAQAGLSIGASGAIMAILAYVCAQYPDTQLSILFLPMFTFSAGTAIKVIMGIDLAGCIMGWKFFDHAAHLGGAMFGLFWTYYGPELWQKRIPILTMYHDWRKTK